MPMFGTCLEDSVRIHCSDCSAAGDYPVERYNQSSGVKRGLEREWEGRITVGKKRDRRTGGGHMGGE